LFLHGVSGTSKTSLAVWLALNALNQKKVSDILYIRSAVENSDNGLGFLKGDLHEKFSVYGVPFFDKLEELVSKPDIDRLKSEERIDTQPINFIRGQNWNARFVILDEAQNTPYKDLKTFLTRRGKFTKMVICADPEQTDLRENKGMGGFERMLNNIFNENKEKSLTPPTDEELDLHKIYQFEFTEEDVVRSEFVKFVCKRL
jgi:phosphate starvation-inducible PhoH-like protein